jgi:anti-sigma factor RsiW
MLWIGDEDINAYIDGALEPSYALAVGAYLAAHPFDAARAAAYSVQRDMLRAAFDLPASPIPDRLAAVPRRFDRRAKWRRRAGAAGALCLALGALGLGGSVLRDHLSRLGVLSSAPSHEAPAAKPQRGRFIPI